jgi:glyoxylase-like metal-dependent hydrolase (beta-lactamase superfamily II)
MAEEVFPGILRIELPLPRNPLRSINSYVILGKNRNLIVDTGMNRIECREVLDRELEKIGLDLSITDVFITHLHADHLGQAPHITKGKNKVYMGPDDIADIRETDYWHRMYEFGVMNGFPKMDPFEAIKKHPGYKYGPLGPMNLIPINHDDRIRVGEFNFTVLHTPGHTHGHHCLYDEEKKLLLSGDHILGDITPNISHWVEHEDPLADYMASLEMVRDLDIDIILPGHRSMINDPRKRIDELIKHHEDRAQEVLDILEDGPMIAFSIAAEMTWDMTYKTFDEFPIMQKWFALGEAIAHIRYLEKQGKITKTIENNLIRYSSN